MARFGGGKIHWNKMDRDTGRAGSSRRAQDGHMTYSTICDGLSGWLWAGCPSVVMMGFKLSPFLRFFWPLLLLKLAAIAAVLATFWA